MRPCIKGEIRKHFAISLFLALLWKFLIKWGNINSVLVLTKMGNDLKRPITIKKRPETTYNEQETT